MRPGRGGLGLDQEPLLELGRIHEVRRKELQGNGPLELEVAWHFGHSTIMLFF